MAGTTKWDDAAVKDLTMAILMSTNEGNINISANWDQVTDTMANWGYGFTKSAMSQQWSKKILKQFRERHGNVKATGNGDTSPKTPKKTAAAPRTRATPKTPGAGRGKKRVAADDEETSPETGYIFDPIAKNKTPRSSAKKVKSEEDEKDNEAKAEAMEKDEDVVDLEEETENAADKNPKEDTDFSV